MEGQAAKSCVDNIYVWSELVQGRLREGKKTAKASDTVCRNGL